MGCWSPKGHDIRKLEFLKLILEIAASAIELIEKLCGNGWDEKPPNFHPKGLYGVTHDDRVDTRLLKPSRSGRERCSCFLKRPIFNGSVELRLEV
jgi:hypothetical protein